MKHNLIYTDEALTTTVDGTAYGAYTSGGTVNGGGASFNITVDGTGAATSVTVNRGGQNYATGETITIADADIGNGGGANLTFDVVAVANTLGIGNISNRIYKLNIAVDSHKLTTFLIRYKQLYPIVSVKFRNVKILCV